MFQTNGRSFTEEGLEADLPEAIARLFPREREVATIVYLRGKATAKEVEVGLTASLTNGSVRSMLNRLVKKGILSRRRSGKHKEFVYVSRITNAQVVENAARQFAEDFFGGSLHRSAMAMVDLVRKERNSASAQYGLNPADRQGPNSSPEQLAA
jgi:predicted transcriptional regulator